MKKLLSLLTLFIFIDNIQAQTSEQTIYRSEFMFCNFNEGKNYQDVLAEQAPYEQFLNENGLEYNRLNLSPIWDNDSEYDYVMWGNWPNGEMQYKEWGAYMNDYPAWASENDIPAQSAGECENFVSMRNHRVLRINSDSYDDRMFSDWRQCTLKPRANMAELKAVFAEMEQMARDNGMGGYAVHFFTPYRGMQDELPYDFLMSYIWFTSEARSAGVANWPEWNAMMEESGLYKKRDKHIESCTGADTYQLDWVYSTIK